jgi:protocatechuate 3,4-dioxygenase beta subunit
MRTTARTVSLLATTSLAIGLLGGLTPASQASPSRHLYHPGPATEAITGLVKALSGAPLTGVTLPSMIRWRLSHFGAGSARPLADQAKASTGSIAGTVTGDGRRLNHICVQAFAQHGRGDFKTTTTGKTGRYQLNGLKAGRYDVTFLADGEQGCPNRGNWLEQWYPGVDSAGPNRETVAVPVRASKVTRGINAQLRHGAEITGTIRSTSGKPLSRICVATLNLSGDNLTMAEYTTGKDGRYTLGGLYPGKYLALFLDCNPKSNYAFQVWRNKSLFSPTPIKVAARQIVTGIDPVLLPGATVTGTIRAGGARGKPVSGVCVSIIGGNGFFSGARTGKPGRFAIKGFGTGQYHLDFDPTCNGSKISPLLDRGSSVKVTGGHTRRLGNVPLRIGARLTGVVTDASGHRLPGVCVAVKDPNDDTAIERTVTGSNGTYSIIGIAPGKFPVRFTGCATAQSVLPQYYNDEPTEASANPVTFRIAKTTAGIDATMHPAGTLTGLVTDNSGRPLPHVCVGIVSLGASGITNSGFGSAITKPNGRYLMRNLIPGPYQVSVGCDGKQFAGRWFNNEQDSALGGFLSIPGGLITTLNGKVGPPGAIAGNITDQAGQPVNNCVFLADPKTKSFIKRSSPLIPAKHGHYLIGGLTPGRYLVQFGSCAEQTVRWYHNVPDLAHARPVTVRAGKTTTGINEVMTAGGSISGTITGPSGQPARNICVRASNPASLAYQQARTNKLGRYTVHSLVRGRYSLYFAPCSGTGPNLGAATRPGLVTVTGTHTRAGVNLALKAGGTITGRLLGGPAGQTPLAGNCVAAIPIAPNGSLQSTRTRADGSYTLPDLAPGKYQVYFDDIYCINFGFYIPQREPTSAPQWFSNQAAQSAATRVTITAGHTTTGIDATMHQFGTIAGIVRTQAGKPVAGECVTAVPPAPQFDPLSGAAIPNVTAITTATGRYTLVALPGQYKIKFTAACGASGFATQWWNDAPSAKTAQPLTVAYGTTTGVNATLHS